MMKLYSYYRSSCSWRVRAAMHLKGIEYETVPVHLVRDGGEQHTREFRRLNPMGQVPVLVDGEQTISDSTAIIEYLEQLHPTPSLLPESAAEAARARRIAALISSGVQPLQNLSTAVHLKSVLNADADTVRSWQRHWIRRGFDSLEQILSEREGQWAAGHRCGYAECFIVPQVYNARRFDLDLSDWPEIQRIDSACSTLPAFVAAHPDAQPDAPAPA